MTLRLPPPLERPLAGAARRTAPRVLLDGDAVVAEARPARGRRSSRRAPVSLAEAERADDAPRPGRGRDLPRVLHVRHPRRARRARDLRRCGGGTRAAARGAVDRRASRRPEIVWAAIDCPGAYAVGAEGRGEVVLGRMTARVDRVPAVGRALRRRLVAARRGRPQALRRHRALRRATASCSRSRGRPGSRRALDRLARRQRDQEPAVVVVRGEEVDGDVLVDPRARADRELPGRACVRPTRGRPPSATASESPSASATSPPDEIGVAVARQLEDAASRREHARLAVADDEPGLGRRVVVLEQLEEEAEPAAPALRRPGSRSPRTRRGRSSGGCSSGR